MMMEVSHCYQNWMNWKNWMSHYHFCSNCSAAHSPHHQDRTMEDRRAHPAHLDPLARPAYRDAPAPAHEAHQDHPALQAHPIHRAHPDH